MKLTVGMPLVLKPSPVLKTPFDVENHTHLSGQYAGKTVYLVGWSDAAFTVVDSIGGVDFRFIVGNPLDLFETPPREAMENHQDVERIMALAMDWLMTWGVVEAGANPDSQSARTAARMTLKDAVTDLVRAADLALELEDVLTAVFREMEHRQGSAKGNAPGHGHEIPGVWDSDNGELAGQPCAWCALWSRAKRMLADRKAGVPPSKSSCDPVIAEAGPTDVAALNATIRDLQQKVMEGQRLLREEIQRGNERTELVLRLRQQLADAGLTAEA